MAGHFKSKLRAALPSRYFVEGVYRYSRFFRLACSGVCYASVEADHLWPVQVKVFGKIGTEATIGEGDIAMAAHDKRGIFLITGIMASGKSTVAQLLAEKFERGVHLRGDTFRKMIVSGREEMLPDSDTDTDGEAVRQLQLRHRISAAAADAYFEAGFNVVLQDVIIGPMLQETVALIRNRPLYVVVLAPNQESVASREANRPKKGYGLWTVSELDRGLREDTPKIGLWIDSSSLTAEETVEQIWQKGWTEALV